MASNNNTGNQKQEKDRTALAIIGKALLIFIALNLLFYISSPLPALGRFSAYNRLFPGRYRLPYGDNPQTSYNLSLFNLDAMLASHELSGPVKAPDEFRVIVVGDSAAWGFLLSPNQTLSAYLNEENITLPDGKHLRAYNLGYPVMSLTKDLLFLDRALEYDPDLILWPLTLESFPKDKQLFPPLLQNNPETVRELIHKYDLDQSYLDGNLIEAGVLDKTIFGARRALADLIRLQLHGVMWAATGIDHEIPQSYTPRMEDLPEDQNFYELQPPRLDEGDLAFDVLNAGINHAGEIPVMIINEPMFISQGMNSDLRYNFYYPRWAFDDFRILMAEQSAQKNWLYFDYWDAIEPAEFTNSAIHMTPEGTQQFARLVAAAIIDLAAAKH